MRYFRANSSNQCVVDIRKRVSPAKPAQLRALHLHTAELHECICESPISSYIGATGMRSEH